MDIKTLLNGINVDPEDIKIADSLSAEDIAKLVSFAKQAYSSYIDQLAKVGELEQKIKDIETQKKVKNGYKPALKTGVSSAVLYELREQGYPINEIAKKYNISRATVWRKLKDEKNKHKNWVNAEDIFIDDDNVENDKTVKDNIDNNINIDDIFIS